MNISVLPRDCPFYILGSISKNEGAEFINNIGPVVSNPYRQQLFCRISEIVIYNSAHEARSGLQNSDDKEIKSPEKCTKCGSFDSSPQSPKLHRTLFDFIQSPN